MKKSLWEENRGIAKSCENSISTSQMLSLTLVNYVVVQIQQRRAL